MVAFDQLVRVNYDLDTGEERVDTLQQISPVTVIATDLDAPTTGVRYAGQARITPRGKQVTVKSVKQRRKKAQRQRHPFLSRNEARSG